MKRIIAAIVSLLLFSSAIDTCASEPVKAKPALEIKTGGGVTGPFFALYLSSSGKLSVKKEGLPFANTKSYLTTDTIDVQLSPRDLAQLISLAKAVDDFSKGCGVVGDGTSARMWLTIEGHTSKFSCDNAFDWPVGAHTLELLTALNKHLPDRLHVF